MARKTGGLAALMSGQTAVVAKKRTMFWRLKALTRQGGLHVGLILVCVLYVYGGAMFFKYIEGPEEEKEHQRISKKYEFLRKNLMENVETVKRIDYGHYRKINESISKLVDDYTKHLMEMFSNPIAANMFESRIYSNTNYSSLWTTDSSLLFAATTIIPVGYGYISPLTPIGRIILCFYAAFGIPLALVMMSDIGKFFADVFVKLFKENVSAFMVVLVFLLVAYSILCGIAISKAVGIPMIDGIYFSTITIFTIGYGDLSPSIPVYVVILFIVFGVALVTISVDIVAANIIHHIHYMGRQVGKAKIIADKMLMMAQKISINRGLGLGMAQLGAFARMGMMINVNQLGNNIGNDSDDTAQEQQYTKVSICENNQPLVSSAFEPDIDFDMIDYKTGSTYYL